MDTMYHNEEYLRKNPTWHEEDSPYKGRKIYEMIQKHKLSPKTIGEVGCGAGGILENLYQKLSSDTNFFGYEISPQAMVLCQPKAKPRLSFYQKDILNENVHYELLLVIDVIEHVEDYIGFLKKIKSKSEYKIFHIPLDLSSYSIYYYFKGILDSRKSVGHIHYFFKELVLAVLEDSGYTIIDWHYNYPLIERPADLPMEKVISIKTTIINFFRKAFYLYNPDKAMRFFGGSSMLVLAR